MLGGRNKGKRSKSNNNDNNSNSNTRSDTSSNSNSPNLPNNRPECQNEVSLKIPQSGKLSKGRLELTPIKTYEEPVLHTRHRTKSDPNDLTSTHVVGKTQTPVTPFSNLEKGSKKNLYNKHGIDKTPTSNVDPTITHYEQLSNPSYSQSSRSVSPNNNEDYGLPRESSNLWRHGNKRGKAGKIKKNYNMMATPHHNKPLKFQNEFSSKGYPNIEELKTKGITNDPSGYSETPSYYYDNIDNIRTPMPRQRSSKMDLTLQDIKSITKRVKRGDYYHPDEIGFKEEFDENLITAQNFANKDNNFQRDSFPSGTFEYIAGRDYDYLAQKQQKIAIHDCPIIHMLILIHRLQPKNFKLLNIPNMQRNKDIMDNIINIPNIQRIKGIMGSIIHNLLLTLIFCRDISSRIRGGLI